MKHLSGAGLTVFKILCANEWLILFRTLFMSFREKILYGCKNKIIAKSRVSVFIKLIKMRPVKCRSVIIVIN